MLKTLRAPVLSLDTRSRGARVFERDHDIFIDLSTLVHKLVITWFRGCLSRTGARNTLTQTVLVVHRFLRRRAPAPSHRVSHAQSCQCLPLLRNVALHSFGARVQSHRGTSVRTCCCLCSRAYTWFSPAPSPVLLLLLSRQLIVRLLVLQLQHLLLSLLQALLLLQLLLLLLLLLLLPLLLLKRILILRRILTHTFFTRDEEATGPTHTRDASSASTKSVISTPVHEHVITCLRS